jgi:hypothetical protein
LRFADSDSSNWVAFQAPATVASNVTWTLPSADGSADQVLVTNGSGTLSFATSSGSNDGFKNRIINGDMRIDQRNAGASVTLTSVGVYTVDRWSGVEDTDGGMTAQQDTSAPTSFVNSLKFTTTTADATLAATQYASCFQKIEGTNVADLAWGSANAKTITISFWTRSSLTGTFGGAINNSGATRSYPFTYSISVADTWEQKFVTIAGDTSGTWLTTTGIGLQVVFGLGVGSTYSGTAGAWAGANYLSATGATSVIGTLNATWYITGVQLEVGSVATPFERRPYGTELALCQRYYWQCTDSLGFTTNANNAYRTPITMPVPMRAAPTLVSGATFTVGSGSAGTPLIFIGTGSPATVTAVWVYNSASNWSTGVAVSLNAGFTSEL